MWRKIYEQNYHKSLDHRSFYFKQQDKRNLSSKVMVQEIREQAERAVYATNALQALSLAAPFSARLHHTLSLPFAPPAVHDDVFRILRAALTHLGPSHTYGPRALAFWRTFWEPFFTQARPGCWRTVVLGGCL